MKCIAIILIYSLLNYCLGCIKPQIIKDKHEIYTRLKIAENSKGVSDQHGIYLKKKDGSRYYLIPETYRVQNDTLFSDAQRITILGREKPAPVIIPLIDIFQMEIRGLADFPVYNPVKQKNLIHKYLNNGNWVYVLESDSSKYFFNAGVYKIISDTLVGRGQQIIFGQKNDPEDHQIALNDIMEIEVDLDDDTFKVKDSDKKSFQITMAFLSFFTIVIVLISIKEMKDFGK